MCQSESEARLLIVLHEASKVVPVKLNVPNAFNKANALLKLAKAMKKAA